jgi:hypothetical protein
MQPRQARAEEMPLARRDIATRKSLARGSWQREQVPALLTRVITIDGDSLRENTCCSGMNTALG